MVNKTLFETSEIVYKLYCVISILHNLLSFYLPLMDTSRFFSVEMKNPFVQ